jgi:hypothetical protein
VAFAWLLFVPAVSPIHLDQERLKSQKNILYSLVPVVILPERPRVKLVVELVNMLRHKKLNRFFSVVDLLVNVIWN